MSEEKEETITLVLTYSEVTFLAQAADYRANRLADLADMTTYKATERSAREESAKYKILAARLADLLAAHESGQVGKL
jgi:hypothetical protein